MPNLATVLKEEITHLARKEFRAQGEGLKKASVQYRRDIAALKREVVVLQKKVALLESKVLAGVPKPKKAEAGEKLRFTAKGLRSQRKKQGLTAGDYSLLVGVTQQSIYNWERGVARPRKVQLEKIAGLRGIGKKELKARLAQLTKKAK